MNDEDWRKDYSGYNLNSWYKKLNSKYDFGSYIENNKELFEKLHKFLQDPGVISDECKIVHGQRFPHDLDFNMPLIWGDEDHGKVIIDILETFGGNNVFGLNGKSEGYIYGISREKSKEILLFNKNIINIGNNKIMGIEEFFGL